MFFSRPPHPLTVGAEDDDRARVRLQHGGGRERPVAHSREDSGGVGEGPVAGEHGRRVREQMQHRQRVVRGGVGHVRERAECAGGQRAGEAEQGDRRVAAPQGLGAGAACFGEKLRAKRVPAQGIPAPDGAVLGGPFLYRLCQQAPPGIEAAPPLTT